MRQLFGSVAVLSLTSCLFVGCSADNKCPSADEAVETGRARDSDTASGDSGGDPGGDSSGDAVDDSGADGEGGDSGGDSGGDEGSDEGGDEGGEGGDEGGETDIPGDYGSAGSAATGNTTYILIPPGGTWTAGLTTKDTPTFGRFSWVPTSYGLPTDGSQARVWLEDDTGSVVCSGPVGFEAALWWSTTGYDLGYGCDLAEGASYTIVMQVCMGANSESVCYGQEPGTQETPLYVSGNWGE